MLYRKVKKTGEELSVLGFGCMRVPQKRGRIDEKRATRQIRSAIDRGVNYLDTAMLYHLGANEPFLGRALRDGYRERINLATKLPPGAVKTRPDMDRLLDAQLDMLRTDRIDYYLLHGIDGQSWNKIRELGALEFLDKAKEDGRIRYAGFSFHGDIDSFKEIVDAYDWEVCLIQYNYLDEHNQAGTEGLKYAAGKGLGVIIMEPLRGGNLTGRIPPAVQAIWDEADVKRSPAEWALRWIWNHPEVTVVLSGMNREDHIEENLRIADEAHPESLSDKELSIVNRAAETYRGLMKAGCTGCRYCMPCPAGVDIPTCFDIYNGSHIFGDKQVARVLYLLRLGGVGDSGKAAYASMCEHCGTCEEVCPQHLPVQALLEDVAKDFEGRGSKAVARLVSLFLGVPRWRAFRRARRVEKRKTFSSRS
jgi:predicted aldo/keto reductase-like oxidoreductase